MLGVRYYVTSLQLKIAQSVGQQLSVADLNPSVINAQYAVRGQVPNAAILLQEELNKSTNKYPFDSITSLNIGNPQVFGQPPISFNRQVLACLVNQDLLKSKEVNQDAIRRAKLYSQLIDVSLGAYTHSSGYPFVREAISKDQTKERPKVSNIIVTDGASQGIHLVMNTLIKNSSDGVMIPIPQYPLYSASITLNGAQQVGYYLDEDKGWSVSEQELENQYKAAVQKGINPKIIVVINPGNPTGQVLDKEAIEQIIRFSYKHNIVIFADEVYQKNIYVENKQFFSFRQVAENLGQPYNQVQLFSFHSISKGISGECGFRGGYVEISESLKSDVLEQIMKLRSIFLCSNSCGQILTGLMVSPPTKEEGCSQETVDNYEKECSDLFNGLKQNSQIVNEILNDMKGITCQKVEGAMYAFPRLHLSDKFLNHSKSLGYSEPDLYYCLQVLENTGLVFVPGSGFHQSPGTYHFRTTTLVRPVKLLKEKLHSYKVWHEKFMTKY